MTILTTWLFYFHRKREYDSIINRKNGTGKSLRPLPAAAPASLLSVQRRINLLAFGLVKNNEKRDKMMER
jgi:hypothetical protein